ncbi:glycoside hydrolase family 18 protein [Pholiota conissans]|uniref:Glycoside hydrolase family 18 protein n=1 Tax=Pholiota conissans TaxID=109636 RepID=A0A9P6D5V6_9AGAR|nr:glycoside hydrolase family 18 protein [Pholiota conissans]
MAYYPDWLGTSFSPSQIDFMLFDWIDFAFAVPNENFELTWDEASAPQLLKELVTAAHGAGRKVKLSIGGWTGSKHFSSAVASNTNRKKFVKSVLTTYRSFELDGIDLDWEYPGKRGDSGNHFRASDSANFLLFLKLLRQTLPTTARISAAVETIPFVDNQGNAMVDVSEFAAVLDWVVIMNYDAWGSLSDPGPNAPLHDACNNSTQPSMNAVAAYNAWTAAQFPASKLVLGLPSYGYINPSTATHLRARTESPERSRKDDLNDDFVTVVSADGGSDHQVQFRELVEQGALVRSTNSSDSIPRFVGNGGFERIWDSCSDTPYLRSIFSKQVITYDDTESLAMKVAFANEVGMLGINLFDIHGDSEQWDLTISVRRAIK